MPAFSCGGMRYQAEWRDLPLQEIPKENQDNLEATIHRALELGINHIETAHGYGSSERQLGLVLPQLDRERITVQTKVSPRADVAEFRATVLASLERLRLDHVDLLGLHGINSYELLWHAVRPDGCLAAARKLQREGKVKHVGFSTHAPLDVILQTITHEGDGGFDYVNLHWYYIFQDNWPAIEAAHRRDMGVFIISPADKGGILYRPPGRLQQLCAPLHPLVFNCLFCLTRPQVHTLSLGAARPSDFDLQCSVLPLLPDGSHHDPQLVTQIAGRLDAALDAAVGADVARHYADGLPAWEATPGHVNIRVILWLRHLVEAFDLREYARMRYNLLGNAGHWFPGLNAERAGSLDWGDKLANSPFADRIPTWLQQAHEQLHGDPAKRLSEA